ncbi:hypothetical protein GCM10025868_10110 [Angustibacter aerolatus]|uniref:Major facilitator superfamily (MFS) profile domain-containing protein n=1 Tax=Angustibacter aerolatus TaxID=1162965 RepID=A0ABQ6JG52_9ACTN|nr:MFS transporter [Angustibacter aerolatus]GMA85761.1 hypothetical protein GCM10025868_10110 [Angustibacter aerolatus]
MAITDAVRVGPVRRSLLALAFGAFGLATGEFVALGLLPQMADGVGVSIPRAGHFVSAYALGVVVGAPLLTAAAVRLPRKGLIIALALALALGNVGSAIAPDYTSLLVLRFVAGLPHGAYFGVAAVMASHLVPEARRSRAMAVVFGGLTLANVVGVPLTTFMGQQTRRRWVFGLVAVLEVLAALAILAVVPRERPEHAAERPSLAREARCLPQARRSGSPSRWRSSAAAPCSPPSPTSRR